MEQSSLIRISNTLNLTRQEFLAGEKHILLLTLLRLKDLQQMGEIDLGSENEVLTVKFSASGLKETNRARIKESMDKISSRKIHFDHSRPGDAYYKFGNIVPFISVQYESLNGSKSEVVVKINPDAKKLFLELSRGYTTVDLKAIMNLKSSYSIRMYELLSMYGSKGFWEVDVDVLKGFLGIELSSYKIFTLFETRILSYSQRELQSYCNLNFTWTVAGRERKKITRLRFEIQKETVSKSLSLGKEISHVQGVFEGFSDVKKQAAFNAVAQNYTFSTTQMNRILRDPELIKRFIEVDLIIEDKIRRGKAPVNRTRYMAKSLGFTKETSSKSGSNQQELPY